MKIVKLIPSIIGFLALLAGFLALLALVIFLAYYEYKKMMFYINQP